MPTDRERRGTAAGRAAATGLVVCALGVLPPPPGAGAKAEAERLTCSTLAARLPEARRATGRLALEGEVRRVEADAVPHQLTLCGAGTPTVLCVTEAAEERQVGENLLVTGTISETGPDFVRLEPCEHRAP